MKLIRSSGRGPTRLVLLAHTANAPSPWLIVSPEGAVMQRGELTLERPLDGPAMRTVVVVPGADVLVRWLDLPTPNEAQAATAAAWRLQDELAAPRERLHVVLAPRPGAGEPRLTAVVSAVLLEAWREYATALNLAPDVMVPDCLMLPEPAETDAVSALRFGPGLALRGRRLALTCDPDLAPVLLDGAEPLAVTDAAAIDRMLADAALTPVVNLLHGGRGDRRAVAGWRAWRVAAGLAAVLALSPPLLWAAEAARDDLAARDLRRRDEAAVQRVWPDTPNGSDPAAEVSRRLATDVAARGFSAPAAALFAAVEQVEGVTLESLAASADGGLRAVLAHPAFGDIEAMNQALAGSGLALREESSLEEGGRILSDVVMTGAGR